MFVQYGWLAQAPVGLKSCTEGCGKLCEKSRDEPCAILLRDSLLLCYNLSLPDNLITPISQLLSIYIYYSIHIKVHNICIRCL
jgi:hypothetical protein